MQWFDTDEKREEFAQWFEDTDHVFETSGPQVILDNGSWMSVANPGDWIVYDEIRDEFDVFSPNVFARTHEAVE